MNRRRLLAIVTMMLGTFLAGCIGNDDDSQENSAQSNKEHNSDSENKNDGGDDGEVSKEKTRIDTPPYTIENSEMSDNSEWNDKYLGEYMKSKPSIPFETLSISINQVKNTGLNGADSPSDGAYQVRVVNNYNDCKKEFDIGEMDDKTQNHLNNIDFSTSTLVLIESGFNSGSVEHRWKRVEFERDVIHIYGYNTEPYEQTDDIDTQFSVLKVEEVPEDLKLARVSLTISEEHRVTFNSNEGIVRI